MAALHITLIIILQEKRSSLVLHSQGKLFPLAHWLGCGLLFGKSSIQLKRDVQRPSLPSLVTTLKRMMALYAKMQFIFQVFVKTPPSWSVFVERTRPGTPSDPGTLRVHPHKESSPLASASEITMPMGYREGTLVISLPKFEQNALSSSGSDVSLTLDLPLDSSFRK